MEKCLILAAFIMNVKAVDLKLLIKPTKELKAAFWYCDKTTETI